MFGHWRRLVVALAAAGLLTGCGIEPSGVLDGGKAPTGVAPGVMLYFVDSTGRLRPEERPTEHLGDVASAVDLLLNGLGGLSHRDGLHTEIADAGGVRVWVTTTTNSIRVALPLTAKDLTSRGIDQVVCTALGVHVMGGGSAGDLKVVVDFTIGRQTEPRSCPVLG